MLSRFIVYRAAWRLTWLSRLLGLAVLALVIWAAVHAAYPFLSPSEPVVTSNLVVEGWLPDSALAGIQAEVNRGRYTRVYLTGGAIYQNEPTAKYGSFPELMKAALVRRGLDSNLLTAVPAPFVAKDRTYASGLALRQWLERQGAPISDFNLVTHGTHARRSRLLFGKAFGYGVRIGIIPEPTTDYDSAHWWRTSAGFREVTGEAIAYIYARFFFYP